LTCSISTGTVWARRAGGRSQRREYEFVDAEGTCILHGQVVGSLSGPAIKWVYELSVPHSPETTTTLRRTDRSTQTASIMQGQREVGWLRPVKQPDGFLIADRDENEVGSRAGGE